MFHVSHLSSGRKVNMGTAYVYQVLVPGTPWPSVCTHICIGEIPLTFYAKSSIDLDNDFRTYM